MKISSLFLVLSLSLSFVLFGCSKESDSDSGSGIYTFINIEGASVFGIGTTSSSSSLRMTVNEGVLLVIDADGEVSVVNDEAVVSSIDAVTDGVIVTLDDGSIYYLNVDGTQNLVETSGDFVGENSEGNIFFSDASIYSPEDDEVTELNTTLENVSVEMMSGNFAVITDGEISQVFDTVTAERENVDRCNGPGIAALSTTMVLVNDCGDDPLMDMSDGGSRSDIAESNPRPEHINPNFYEVDDGAIFLSQSCPVEGLDYTVCHVAPNGTVTNLVTEASSPGSGSDYFIGNETHFVVRELDKVWFGERGTDAKNVILDDYNMTSISLSESIVYYLGEDGQGNAVSGMYNIETEENEALLYEGGVITDITPIN